MSLSMSRRAVLASSIGLFLSSNTPSRAEPTTLAVIAASASVISAILAFQQKGGSLALQFDAAQVKLDAILNNQRLLLDAISEVNDSVHLVLQVAAIGPATTVALIHLSDTQLLSDKLIEKIAILERSRNNRAAKKELADLFPQLNDIAIRLKNDAAGTSVPLELAFACYHIKAVLFALNKQKHIVGADKKASLFSTCVFLEEALTAITLDRGILSHLPLVQTSIAKIVVEIGNHSLKSLLPVNFSDFSDTPHLEKNEVTTACLKTGYNETQVSSTKIKQKLNEPDMPMGTYEVVGRIDTFDEFTTLTYPMFLLKGTRIVGGRFCYSLDIKNPRDFGSQVWKQRVHRRQIFEEKDVEIQSSDPVVIIEKCQSLAVDKDLIPQQALAEFLVLLSKYDALVAVETRILGLQSASTASKVEVAIFKERLRA
jgi:hypothetical protein